MGRDHATAVYGFSFHLPFIGYLIAPNKNQGRIITLDPPHVLTIRLKEFEFQGFFLVHHH